MSFGCSHWGWRVSYLHFLWVQISGAFPAPVGPKLSLLILINLSNPCIFAEASAVFRNCVDQYCFYNTSEIKCYSLDMLQMKLIYIEDDLNFSFSLFLYPSLLPSLKTKYLVFRFSSCLYPLQNI